MNGAAGADLDLRFRGKLDPEVNAIFNTVAHALRGPFSDLVARMSRPHSDSLDWWVEDAASRNTYASPFFHYYCCLHLVRRLVDDGRLTYRQLIVDSRVLRDVLARLLADAGIQGCRVRHAVGTRTAAKRLVKQFAGTALFLARTSCQTLIARRTGNASDITIPNHPIVVIDTFIMPEYTTSDHWYGRLWQSLTDEMKTETFFVPTLVTTPVRSMHATYKSLRSNTRRFLIKEDYLTIGDLVFAAQHKRRLKRLSIAPLMVLGYDLSDLVTEEWASNRDPLTAIESLLTYRFVKRMCERGVRIRLAIDWFEGHAIDKAWNLAFKRYYPATKRIGVLAFERSPFYLSTFPIEVEREAGVIPDVIAVQGAAAALTVREFLPDLDIVVIPALRAQHVWEYAENRSPANRFTILVALPSSVHASARIARHVLDAYALIHDEDLTIELILKRHPEVSREKLAVQLPEQLPTGVVFTSEPSLPRLLSRADVLITEASSTCLEALACGVPVIIVENEEGLTYDPIPATISGELYRRVRTGTQLAEELNQYRRRTPEELQRQKADSQQIRQDYFEPITRAGIDRLMNTNMNERPAHV